MWKGPFGFVSKGRAQWFASFWFPFPNQLLERLRQLPNARIYPQTARLLSMNGSIRSLRNTELDTPKYTARHIHVLQPLDECVHHLVRTSGVQFRYDPPPTPSQYSLAGHVHPAFAMKNLVSQKNEEKETRKPGVCCTCVPKKRQACAIRGVGVTAHRACSAVSSRRRMASARRHADHRRNGGPAPGAKARGPSGLRVFAFRVGGLSPRASPNHRCMGAGAKKKRCSPRAPRFREEKNNLKPPTPHQMRTLGFKPQFQGGGCIQLLTKGKHSFNG